MGRQKSYVITETADTMAAELAEKNGLTKSVLLEILIRQAHYAKWSVVTSPAEWAPPVPKGRGPKLRDLPLDARLRGSLVAFTTLGQVAAFGEQQLLLLRGLGQLGVDRIRRLCQEYGEELKP